MIAEPTTLNSLADAISRLTVMVQTGFSDLNQKFEDLERRVANLEVQIAGLQGQVGDLNSRVSNLEVQVTDLATSQRETNQRLEHLEGNSIALEADVKELYFMIDELRKDFHTFTKEEKKRFSHLESFAVKVSRKTGITFRPRFYKA